MRTFILYLCAVLFAVSACADAQAQMAFFYKELPELALDNESVEIEVTTMYDGDVMVSGYYNPSLCVRIKNRTDKMLYVDLGTTFITVNDEGRCYYVPTSTSTTEGQSRGAGVNLGAVAGALGGGGVVGAVLGGVNVGGGNISAQTTTTFAQRVIVVPPMSAKRLTPQPIIIAPIPEMAVHCRKDNNAPFCPYSVKKYNRVPDGGMRTFGPSESNLQFSVIVTCSFDEGCAETFAVRRGYYVDRAACFKPWKAFDAYEGKDKQDKLLKVFPDWNSWGDFFLLCVI